MNPLFYHGLLSLLCSLFLSLHAFANEQVVTIDTGSGILAGTLLTPDKNASNIAALIIAGSGPTDRNGNNSVMKNDSLKLLAQALADKGIATLRYDKRGIGQSAKAGIAEDKLRFEHYIDDARNWISFLKTQQFQKIVVIGHSEGSLIGMVASQLPSVDKFISLAGAGQPIDKVLRQQLAAQPPIVLQLSTPILDKLLQGQLVEDVPLMLAALFRTSVQPYLISWFKYNPQREIAKLNKPVLIVQGTTDIQVAVEEAEMLQKAKPDASLKIIEDMNHIFKLAPMERSANIATYSQPNLPIIEALPEVLVAFINQK